MWHNMPIRHIHVKHEYSSHDFAESHALSHNENMNMENIRRLRNLTQEDLADMVESSQPTIGRAEKLYPGTTIRLYLKIANALRVPLADLFLEDRSTAESILVDAFRRLPPERQQGWLDMARTVHAIPDQELPARQQTAYPTVRKSTV